MCPRSISSGKSFFYLMQSFAELVDCQSVTWLAGDAGKDVNGAVIPVYGSDV